MFCRPLVFKYYSSNFSNYSKIYHNGR